jgi:CelD/BcsL family acetyltransferase involved in cellulose biosynthesis
VEPAVEEEFAEAAAEFCLSSLRDGLCDLIDVHAFPHDLPFMRRWTEALKSRGLVMSIRDREVPRIRIDLPKTVPEYFVMLSAKERQHIRRKERLLRGAGVEYECVTEPGDHASFQDYVRLSRSLWDGQESGSYFSVREGFTRFQEEVTGRLLSEGKARLYFFRQDGRRFAALHAFLMNGVFQAYLGGRDPHHPLSRWSPGLMLMAHAIQCAIDEGFTQFDFLTGNQPYKHSLGGTVHGWHGRVTAALRGPRGWKGILMILTHNLAMGAGRRLGRGRLVRLFDRISAASRNNST